MGTDVYFSKTITPEKVLELYKLVGKDLPGKVAVKVHSGEKGNQNFLKPDFWKPMIQYVNGTVVECNTAYEGARNTTDRHLKLMEEHGWSSLFDVDILDGEGPDLELSIPNGKKIKKNYVGKNVAKYDSMLVLSHFKGHPMGGYGGALKNLSIGCASRNGKAYIHSAGKMNKLDERKLWTREFIGDQDGFLESMAAAAQAVHNYFERENGVIYISVMNNMSVDCDCVDHPAPVKLNDYGILASADPVALDQACVDIVNNLEVTAESDPTDLLKRIDKQHGTHTIDWAEKIGLGSKKYKIINIDK